MKIHPFIIGSGRSANAIKKSLTLLNVQYPEWDIKRPIQIERNQELSQLPSEFENSILFIANPHGLHAHSIQEGVNAGFHAIVVEKPACVSLEEIEKLRSIPIPVAVCHIYRQMWGIQTLKQMLDSQEMGDLICIEGRYWQSSTAQRSMGSSVHTQSWKNNPHLSGYFDAFIDVGVHWVDAAAYLIGTPPSNGIVWFSYANAEASHRDSHVHLNLEFHQGKRAMASISKTLHGATNHFEINVIGTKKSATWTFLNPDEIFIGEGNSRKILARKDTQLGSRQPPFHGLGWLEGYMEIIRQVILELEAKAQGNKNHIGIESGNYPKLQENLDLLSSLLSLKRIRS